MTNNLQKILMMKKQLIKNRRQLLFLGGMLMVVATFMTIAATLSFSDNKSGWMWLALEFMPWSFLSGAIMFAVVQRDLRISVSADNITINRLYRIQTFSHILFILTGAIMVENYNQFLKPFFMSSIDSYQTYLQLFHNNWVVFLLIASLLQIYSVLRLDACLKSKD